MELKTKRLILRPWSEDDAESLYEYARDPRVGPVAGWPVHTDVENSREIIKNVLSAEETYAVCLKSDNRAIGSIGLMISGNAHLPLTDTEAELGYWIGVPFWGKGLIPEAGEEILRYAFEELNLEKVWCGYFDGNEKSRRVQEKLHFQHEKTIENIPCQLIGDTRTCHYSSINKHLWKRDE